MSASPVLTMLNHLQSTPPTSPRRRHVLPPLVTTPSCPMLSRTQMNIPSIVNGTPPSSPITKTATPPATPIIQPNMQTLSVSSIATVSSSLNVSSNKRIQPMARPMNLKMGKRKLGPGCGLLDWIRLCRSKKDLTGTGGVKKPITLEELAEHNTEDDAWTAIRGKVYNLTFYMKFHPGGKEELMRGAGIDCTILFNEAHTGVNVESTLKACYVGPLVASSPNTTRRKNSTIMKNAVKLRQEATLAVPKTITITDGKDSQTVSTAPEKNSMELRTETQAATACEEPDGIRQESPDSPIRPLVGETKSKKISDNTTEEAAEGSSMRLTLPPTRIRRNSEPHPRFDWVQSEKAITIHIVTHQNIVLKTSDVILDVDGKSFEAAIFMNDWVFELNIALAHAVVSSNVTISCGRVEISLKKEEPHRQWDVIGTFLTGHAQLSSKSRRGTKYHSTHVESIETVNHDTKLYTLRLPTASYLNVPTGHHLSIKANIDGKDVERSYTPVSTMEANTQRNGHPMAQPDGEIIELIIKHYKDGKMSRFLSNLKEGDEVIVSDPEGSFDSISKLSFASDILLIAAGSGFTPMVKILRDYLSTELVSRQRYISASEASGEASQEDQQAPELRPATTTACECPNEIIPTNCPRRAKLLFANKTEKDIMSRVELDHLAQATANRFSVTHILSNPDNTWHGMKGRIGETLLKANLPVVDPQKLQNSLVCVCGPEPFMASISNILLDMEFPDECIHCFQ